MTKDILVFSCAHTAPEVSNERFDWLGHYIADVKPDMVIDLGDGADMCSLNSFDSTPQAIVMQNYGERHQPLQRSYGTPPGTTQET